MTPEQVIRRIEHMQATLQDARGTALDIIDRQKEQIESIRRVLNRLGRASA